MVLVTKANGPNSRRSANGIKSGSSYEITQQEADTLRGAKPGVNLPIFFNGEIVGVVGLTGLPEQIRNYGKLVRMAAEMIFQEMILIEEIQWDERLKEELVHQLLQQEEPLDSLFLNERIGLILTYTFQEWH